MYIHNKEKLDDILTLFQKLRRRPERTTIIVEGKKDRYSLRRLGIKGNIKCVKNSGRTLFDVVDQILSDEVILLMDFDEYGTALSQRKAEYLERKRIKINLIFWRKIKSLVASDVKDIEGLPSFLEKLKKSAYIHL